MPTSTIRAILIIVFACGAVIGSAALIGNRSAARDDIAFLERLAVNIEHVSAVAPETRDQLSAMMQRHATPVLDPRLEQRRQKALMRLKLALRPGDAAETVAAGAEAMPENPLVIRTILPAPN
jgi:hypothetical protein